MQSQRSSAEISADIIQQIDVYIAKLSRARDETEAESYFEYFKEKICFIAEDSWPFGLNEEEAISLENLLTSTALQSARPFYRYIPSMRSELVRDLKWIKPFFEKATYGEIPDTVAEFKRKV